MLPEQQQRIMGYFIEEAKDHLNTIEQGLLNLQATIEDSEMANELFRAAHSVKGGAAMLGLESIQRTAHRMEDYFKILKESPIQTDRTLESMFLQVFDALHELLAQLQGPFGLTEDKAQEIMVAVEPVFGQLNDHLNHLVAGASPVVSQPQSRAVTTPVAATAQSSIAGEDSALQLVFKSDVSASLREMLSLFKQADTSANRQSLQAACRRLERLGEQFELPAWIDLVSTARLAIAHSENDYRTLAPILIKEIKKAQDLVLNGQAPEVSVSDALQALLPPEPVPMIDEGALITHDLGIDDLDDLTLNDLGIEGLDTGDLAVSDLTTDDLFGTASESEDSPEFDDLFGTASPSADNPDFESHQSFTHSSTEVALPSRTADPFLEDLLTTGAEPTGPEVGTAELNSLADLFEGDLADLDSAWQEEEVALDPGQDSSDLLDVDISTDFADLLEDDGSIGPLSSSFDSGDELADLFDEVLPDTQLQSNLDTTDEPTPENSSSDDSSLDIEALTFAEPSDAHLDLIAIDMDVEATTRPTADADDFFNEPIVIPTDSLSSGGLAEIDDFFGSAETVVNPPTPEPDIDLLGDFWDSSSSDASMGNDSLPTKLPDPALGLESPDLAAVDLDSLSEAPINDTVASNLSDVFTDIEEAALSDLLPDAEENATTFDFSGLESGLDQPFTSSSNQNVSFSDLVADAETDDLMDDLLNESGLVDGELPFGLHESDIQLDDSPEILTDDPLSMSSNDFESGFELDELDFGSLSGTEISESGISESGISESEISESDLDSANLESLDQPNSNLFDFDLPVDPPAEMTPVDVDALNLTTDLLTEGAEADLNHAFTDFDNPDTLDFDASSLDLGDELPDVSSDSSSLSFDDAFLSSPTDAPALDRNEFVAPSSDELSLDFDETPLAASSDELSLDFEEALSTASSDEVSSDLDAEFAVFSADNAALDLGDELVILSSDEASPDFDDELTALSSDEVPLDLDSEQAFASLNLNDEFSATSADEIFLDLGDQFLATSLDETSLDLGDEFLSIPSNEASLDLGNEFSVAALDEISLDLGDEFSAISLDETSLNLGDEFSDISSNGTSLDLGSEFSAPALDEISLDLGDELSADLGDEFSTAALDEISLDLGDEFSTTSSNEASLELGNEFSTATFDEMSLDLGDEFSTTSSNETFPELGDEFSTAALDEMSLDLGNEFSGALENEESLRLEDEFSVASSDNSPLNLGDEFTGLSSEDLSLDLEDELTNLSSHDDDPEPGDDLFSLSSNETSLNLENEFTDFSIEADALVLDNELVDFGSTEVVETPEHPESSADFDDLEALLEDEVALSDLSQATSPYSETSETSSVSSTQIEFSDAEFSDLDTLLAEDELPVPPSIGITDNSDDFSDLDALLAEDESDAAFLEPSSDIASIDSNGENGSDGFDDLERLLEEADQSLGGPTGASSNRRVMPATNRLAGRRSGSALNEQTMRVSVGHLDNLSNLVGELVVNRNTLEQDQERLRQFLDNLLFQVQQLNDVGQRMRDLYERSLLESSLISSRQSYQMSPLNSSVVASANHATGETFDALEMDRFTGFHTLSQEMIELIVRVRESASDIAYTVESADQVTRQFRQVTTQLQEGLNKARMVPFGSTADRLPRAVRDISLKCGKDARLVVEGRDTLIDKMILEQLYDPMTHLVNNAITHGVETPDVRVAAGKPPQGAITVRAFYQGNQTVIYVADDGGGINADLVKRKAVQKGLISAAEAKAFSVLDVYELLFHPGFSTRDQADDFAGRGVGMDVVRTSLSDIRGSITIDSELGKGTSFTIRLPLTLSISKALSCVSNQARIAFPMDGVEDMFDVPRERIQQNEQGQQCILWRDTLLPFQQLSDLLKFNRTLGRGRVYGGHQDDDVISIVVLRSASTYIALEVDQVIGEQEIVIKQLEGPVPKPIGIAGATVLGDGRVMPIADVLELIDLAMGRVRRDPSTALWTQVESAASEEPVAIKTEPTVLIVDDSITVRELLSMSFNKVGYRVEQARDGQEAWEKLRSGLPCELVFCDIEMPRMDGLELLSRLQKDSTLKRIPIAMLTSRGADRHRQMAVDLGASGYFTKPYLEEALLDAAQRMLNGDKLV